MYDYLKKGKNMPESNNFFSNFFKDPMYERVVEYIVREIGLDRDLFEILEDTFVRNRIPKEQVNMLLESPDVLEAFESELAELRASE